ncbi:hypothetical protein BJ170DRAFT_193818 [Xylariales sp. AK1849]|nr:hypothetical protein BJ170DRAFT_193818 [Xylariales sp. AK1849]
MPSYTVTEPHPTVPQDSYARSGRGGAGNFFRAPATTPSSGIVTPTSSMPMPPSTGRFHAGRGGAGNVRTAAERPVMSFDEQYKIQSQIDDKPITHVGRGGAGNIYSSRDPQSTRKASDASSHRSNSSSGSVKSSFMNRLSQTISSKSHN